MKNSIYFLAILNCCLAFPSQWDELCGVRNNLPVPRIVGGSEVEPNSVPYQVVLLNNGINLCAGSLISTTRVLSAAHCTVTASFIQLIFGVHNYNEQEPTQVRLTSTNVVHHEDYDGFVTNDISIVRLPSAVTLTPAIQTVTLAPPAASTLEGTTAFLAGWGLTENHQLSPVLRGVNLTIISNAECADLFPTVVRDTVLCTSGNGGVGACSSDSGGALVVDGVQVGLVSFGAGNCAGGNPTGYTRISSYREWIQTNAEI